MSVTTLLWSDDFEAYTAASAPPAPYTVTGTGSRVVNTLAHGGTKSLASGVTGTACTVTRPLGANYAQLTLDYWVYVPTFASGDVADHQLVGVRQSTPSNVLGCSFNQDGTGHIKTGAASQTAYSFSRDAWHHCVFAATMAASGLATLSIDGVLAASFAGDTRIDGTVVNVNQFVAVGQAIGPSPAAEFYLDDLFVYSGIGAAQARAMVLA